MSERQVTPPGRDAGAQALFDAAARVMRHHLGRLDERFRQMPASEQDSELPDAPAPEQRH